MNPSAPEKASAARPCQKPEAGHKNASNHAGSPTEDASPPLSNIGAARVLGFALESPGEDTSGARIGAYKLLQKIGEGGFGVVWMAEQQEPIRRRVAVKIIKLGMDTEDVIARFEAERQALALMEHPNIARVFEAGATAAGRPFFVMELVRGVAITRYCDENRLGAEARLRLFIMVCHAVQHAHHKGVIHRDLKPSNILVTLHDGVPVPKIIDFGIAKATSARLTEKTLFTQFHAFVGTPAYTSPEQMEMSGLDIDTRSDIYSLGVLLYELLTGQPPFDSDTLVKSGLDAMRRTLREVDPPRPSLRLSTLNESTRTSVAAARGTDATKLSLLLRGDLDWIAMRCLEKDRTRRYDSATALAADVERYLADAPVLARPPSRLYQAKKFVHRHKVGVAAAVAVALSLVAGLIAVSTLLVRERSAHRRAVLAEQKEGKLRRQSEVARTDEVKRAAHTALDLANRHLADGRVADGLAYLVYAARKDPRNRTLAPRLASVLASHNFALLRAAPYPCNSRVLALRFAPDGRTFFVGTEDGTLRVMDAATGALQRQFQLGRKVIPGGWEFARSNDTVVGARFSDNTFGVFDLATGAARFAALPLDPKVGLPNSQRAVGLSPTGRWIYANAPLKFWLWDARTGALQLNLDFTELIGGCDFSPADDTLVLPVGNSLERWSLPAGERVPAPIQFRAQPSSGTPSNAETRYSPDGRRLAVFDYSMAQIFDATTGTLVQALPTPGLFFSPNRMAFPANDRVFVQTQTQSGWWDLAADRFSVSPIPNLVDVAFTAAGTRGLATSLDGLFRVFDADRSALVTEPAWGQDTDYCAAISPDGSALILGTADGLVYRFGLGRGAARPLVLPRSLSPFVSLAYFLPEAPSRLLWLTRDHATVIDATSGREIAGGFRYPQPLAPNNAWHDTHPPVRSDLKFLVARTETGEWQSWELGLGGIQRVVPLQHAPKRDAHLAFSATGDLVSLAFIRPNEVEVWNLRTGVPVGPPFVYTANLVPMTPQFSPDGRRLAVGANDGAALIFELAAPRPVLRLDTPPLAATMRVFFSADGSRVVTSNANGATLLWNAATGEPMGPGVHLTGSVWQSLFSPDGKWLATWNSQTVRVTDGRTGAPVGKMIPAGGKLVFFNPDSTRLATAEREGYAQVWDVPSGDAVTEPLRHQPLNANRPEFSPDDRFLKTENGRFYLWAIPPPWRDGVPPPEWLFELATLCAGKTVDDFGHLVAATDAAQNVTRLRREIAALPADAPLADWGRWVLDDRPERSIAPGFTITPAEAERLAAAPAIAQP